MATIIVFKSLTGDTIITSNTSFGYIGDCNVPSAETLHDFIVACRIRDLHFVTATVDIDDLPKWEKLGFELIGGGGIECHIGISTF